MSAAIIPQYTQNALEELRDKVSVRLNESGFYLAGGTALTFQIQHRLSTDLDWFTPTKFDPNVLGAQLREDGVNVSQIEISEGTLHCKIGECDVSFFHYPYKMLDELQAIDGSSDLNMAGLRDIALMKITAIADRGTKKDFVDLYFIITQHVSLRELLDVFEIKYPDSSVYHYLKALTYFDDADKMPDLEMLRQVTWNDVKKKIVKQVRDLQLA